MFVSRVVMFTWDLLFCLFKRIASNDVAPLLRSDPIVGFEPDPGCFDTTNCSTPNLAPGVERRCHIYIYIYIFTYKL